MTVPAPEDTSPATVNLLDFVFAEVWQRPGLTRRERRFVTLPLRGGRRCRSTAARPRVRRTQHGDLSIVEMQETVLHFAVYAGWPKASWFNMVVDEQWGGSTGNVDYRCRMPYRCCR